jgi:DNA-binding transcriptional ArsR family regulator
MKAFIILLIVVFTGFADLSSAAPESVVKDNLNQQMTQAASAFLKTLNNEQRGEVMRPLSDTVRFNWHFIPRDRLGLNLKRMNPSQRKAALHMVEVVLSDKGYQKIRKVIDLENVLRVLETRPPNDTRRDPENYAFLVFGDPATKQPWGWRMEGHHISLHYTSVDGHISFTPSFLGSNPGHVLIDVPQKGLRVLGEEEDLGFQLLSSFSEDQKKRIILAEKSPYEIFSANKRQVDGMEIREGLAMKDMTSAQQQLFKKLISVYLDRYHITLKNQQMKQLESAGMGNIHFAWMGNSTLKMGKGEGHYYRIHGPTLLIEFDNTQNDANHIHTVVRDLTDDFAEDLLKKHYEQSH